MPQLTGPQQVISSATDLNSATPGHKVLTRAEDANGNVYILLGGVASTAIGSPVKFDESGSTTLLAADAVGPVAVAMAAVTSASNYGWYKVYGDGFVLAGNDIATQDVATYISGTTGYVSDLDVAGDVVVGMVFTGTLAAASGTVRVWLNYPYVSDIAIN